MEKKLQIRIKRLLEALKSSQEAIKSSKMDVKIKVYKFNADLIDEIENKNEKEKTKN